MQHVTRVVLTTFLMALSSSPASAQGERRFGIVIAYPSSVGLEWQGAERVGVRVDGDFAGVTHTVTTEVGLPRLSPGLPSLPDLDITTTTRSRNLELGVSLLFDLHHSEDLRLYVAPRFAVNLLNTTVENEINGDPALLAAITVPAKTETRSTSPGGGVALGASRDLGERFRVFGETGFNYQRRNVAAAPGTDADGTAFGLRAGVGVVVRF